MSRAAIARLEVLLARVEARKNEPRALRIAPVMVLAPPPAEETPTPAAERPTPVVEAPRTVVPVASVDTVPSIPSRMIPTAPRPEALSSDDRVAIARAPVSDAHSAVPVLVPSDVPTMAPRAMEAAEALHMPPATSVPSDLEGNFATTPVPAKGPERFEPTAIEEAEGVRVVLPSAPPRPATFHGMLQRSLALRPRF